MFDYSDGIIEDNGNVQIKKYSYVSIDDFILFLMVMKQEKGFDSIHLTTYEEQTDLNTEDGDFEVQDKPMIKLTKF